MLIWNSKSWKKQYRPKEAAPKNAQLGAQPGMDDAPRIENWRRKTKADLIGKFIFHDLNHVENAPTQGFYQSECNWIPAWIWSWNWRLFEYSNYLFSVLQTHRHTSKRAPTVIWRDSFGLPWIMNKEDFDDEDCKPSEFPRIDGFRIHYSPFKRVFQFIFYEIIIGIQFGSLLRDPHPMKQCSGFGVHKKMLLEHLLNSESGLEAWNWKTNAFPNQFFSLFTSNIICITKLTELKSDEIKWSPMNISIW